MKKQSRFTAEFNMPPIKRLLEGGRELSGVANELGLSTGQLSTWRKEQLAAGSAETLWLRHELKWLEEENLILQGRGGFCARDRVTKLAFVLAERGNHSDRRVILSILPLDVQRRDPRMGAALPSVLALFKTRAIPGG